MAHNDLEKNSEKYVVAYYGSNSVAGNYFHDLRHTTSVVKTIKQIAAQSGLSKTEIRYLKIAAWFQFIGFLESPERPEEASAELAMNFLIRENAGDEPLRIIPALIRAKASKTFPSDPLEETLFDACHRYMAQKSFSDNNRALKLEEEFFKHQEIGKTEWLKRSIVAFENFQYYTAYGRTAFTKKKDSNLAKLKKELWVRELDLAEKHAEPAGKKSMAIHQEKEATERGIDTMFRVACSYNERLISVADNKAHLLITVNSIMMSAIISLVLRKLPENNYLSLPTFILLVTSFLSTIFSILATRPPVPAGKFTQPEMEKREVNLLYFGNYYKMEADEYLHSLHQVIASQGFLYDMLARNIYAQGKILGKKYDFLRKAYSIFLFGLTISILAFMIAYFLRPLPEVTRT
ncbi:hypothetical protein FPZ43_14255 [Mucilaginibacter pallidiroseus]|uniref:Pycsar effector protein domain-containing protein n=1 Tax=Mucilaginibacter pallidiroseus TaxID=2599295 RepID=A0A563U4N7_9SPHI|nr:Pycsar system effector family protein [Mucilaginibacter pallidiroseus]TWR26324.1 hypothetical protein FPZ43_14255 [Mucilaginibacter pallidiroseus]